VKREIDHFIPWSQSGDDGIDNLVAACHRCNNAKRSTLPGPSHMTDLIERNQKWHYDLGALAEERRWPRDRERSARIARSAYLRSPDERPLWIRSATGMTYEPLGAHRREVALLLR
jgi:CRISPR/Cas system Type II protein with McrA/HNH and RuvC-like nuclease domain